MNRRRFLRLAATAPAIPAVQGCVQSEIRDPASIKSGFAASGFQADSTAEEVTQGLDLTGKTILVTGCTSGLGLETMRVLAMRGAHVLGTGRTMEKARAACSSVEGTTTPLVLELADFDSIRTCADEVVATGLALDAIICNAGISAPPQKKLVNGIEITFSVNYLGHFHLVNRLLPSLATSRACRIVHVSSRSAYTQAPVNGIRFDSLGESNAGIEYNQWDYYGQSKLANALFSLKLSQMYAGTGITSNALHPGFVQTNIDRDQSWFFRAVFNVIQLFTARSVEQGAATICYAAVHPNMSSITGQFLSDSNVIAVAGPHHLNNEQLADRLWRYSEATIPL